MSNANELFQGHFQAQGYARRADEEAPDPRWTAADRRIAELQEEVSKLQSEKATIREHVVAEIRATAEEAAAMNQRLQAFNNEITPDMDGAAIKKLARKYSL